MDYALEYSRPRIVAVISFPYDNIKGYFLNTIESLNIASSFIIDMNLLNSFC